MTTPWFIVDRYVIEGNERIFHSSCEVASLDQALRADPPLPLHTPIEWQECRDPERYNLRAYAYEEMLRHTADESSKAHYQQVYEGLCLRMDQLLAEAGRE